ncbi:MAG: hypothetical protein WCD04_04000 [Terriglobia bacterium]|jgi:hypothetical protein
MGEKPEEKSRREIDKLLTDAGWKVQDVSEANVTAGLVKPAEGREWSGARDCAGCLDSEVRENPILSVDRVGLLVNEGTRI